jgi:hypothetical protein
LVRLRSRFGVAGGVEESYTAPFDEQPLEVVCRNIVRRRIVHDAI